MAKTPTPMKPPAEDLAELDKVQQAQDVGVLVELKNADRVSPLGFGIQIAGPDSQQAQTARDKMQDAVILLGDTVISDMQRREIETRYLARRCIRFSQRAILDGAVLENTEDDFMKLLVRFPFIRRQIDDVANRRTDFLPPSGDSSSKESTSQSLDESGAQQEQGSGSGTSSGN